MNIEVNQAKCGNAMDCRLCLNVCPSRVFLITPSGDETSAIVPFLLSQCVECDLCVEQCPKEAITLVH